MRWRAASALGRLGQAEPGVVETLVGLLGEKRIDLIWVFRLLRGKREVVSFLITAIYDSDETIRSGAAFILDPDSGIGFEGETDSAISSQHVSSLQQLLNSKAEVDYSIFFDDILDKRRKVKDVAWGLLRRYSEETGERVYWGGGGE